VPVYPSLGHSNLLLESELMSSLKDEFPEIPFRMVESDTDQVDEWKKDQEEVVYSEEFGNWANNMDEVSWALVTSDSRLATQTCNQFELGHMIVDKKRRGSDEGLLGASSDDEEEDILVKKEIMVKEENQEKVRAPIVMIKTAFSSEPITLSHEASELYARWKSPDDFYGSGSGVVSSISDGKKLNKKTKRRLAYERKKKEAVDRSLEVLMSQASAGAQESAPRISFGSQLSGGGIVSNGGAGSIGLGRSGNLKPKKKARQGF
jgi:hypothetical protein